MSTLLLLQQILLHTPVFVWALLALCIVMGLLQRRNQQLTQARLIIPSVIWTVFGLWGVSSAAGLQGLPAAAWLAALIAAVAVLRGRLVPAGARFDPASGRFRVPGSWWPMALILGIFSVKYAVGVSLGLHLAVTQQPAFAPAVSALYGALSGLFVARTLNLLALGTRRPLTARLA